MEFVRQVTRVDAVFSVFIYEKQSEFVPAFQSGYCCSFVFNSCATAMTQTTNQSNLERGNNDNNSLAVFAKWLDASKSNEHSIIW